MRKLPTETTLVTEARGRRKKSYCLPVRFVPKKKGNSGVDLSVRLGWPFVPLAHGLFTPLCPVDLL